MKRLKVVIMTEMPAKGYSGGRYSAWIMAEALAYEGNQVYVVTNNIPEFKKDFEQYPNHNRIRLILTNCFYDISLREKKIDYVICIPSISAGKEFYYACLDYSIAVNARFAFVNFETPNWYGECAEITRPENDYQILKKICKYGCLILSLAYESQRYAKKYYNRFPIQTEFCVWSPPINSVAADSIKEVKSNQIIYFLRNKDKHKGGDDFLKILGEYLRGMTCVCVVGTGEIEKAFLEKVCVKEKKYGITIKFEKSLSDYRKFQEIKKSKLLLFPSHFEGYGYPPVEALYCGTRCIAYDLPVLREISGDALTYCEKGNISLMREKAEQLLKEKEIGAVCVDTAEFTRQADRLQHILADNLENPKLKCQKSLIVKMRGVIRKQYYIQKKNRRKFVPEVIKYCIDNKVIISQNLINSNEKWKEIKKRIRGKDIYIWGCGRAYQELYPKYKNKFKIQGLLDKSLDKIGTQDRVSGKMIIQTPDILKEKDKESTVVLISNKENVDAIIEELKKMKIKYYHSLCMIELNSFESKVYRILLRRHL